METKIIQIERVHRLVLTVRSIETRAAFYKIAPGMEFVTFGDARHALRFGGEKINLHAQRRELKPHAARASPGSADVSLIMETPLDAVREHLPRCGVQIPERPAARSAALGPIRSADFRDPDGDLLEASRYDA